MSIDELNNDDIVLITKDNGETTPKWKVVAKIKGDAKQEIKDSLFEQYKSFKQRKNINAKILKVIQ